MQAIILAGGMGTRLRPLTYTVPKPMLPIAGEPALMHTVRSLAQAGFKEVIVTTNYLAETVTEGIEKYQPPIPVRCIKEARAMGTAGCIKNVIDDLDDEFLVIQGDAVADIDYAQFLEFHRAHNADVSLSVMRVQDTREFGIVAVDADGRITRFQEKPRPEEAFSDLANAGFYVLKKQIFDEVPRDEEYDFSRQLFPSLMEQGARFYAWEMNSYWIDIGRVNNYLDGNRHRLQGRAEIAPDVLVPATTNLLPPFRIESGVQIGEGCRIGPNVAIGHDCILGKNARITGSVLFDEVTLGADVQLTDCVIARHSRLDNDVSIEPLAVVGEDCRVGAQVQVASHSRVGPMVEIPPGTIVEGLVAPHPDKLAALQRDGVSSSRLGNLPADQGAICTMLQTFGEMTARDLAVKTTLPFSRTHRALEELEESGLLLSTLDLPKRYALTSDA